MSERTGTERMRVRCPCGSVVGVGDSDGEPAVFHPLPVCADFEKRDVIEYVVWLRKQREGHS